MNYVLKILETALQKERKELVFWTKQLNAHSELAVKQADGNIPACGSRIAELEKYIDVVKSTRPTKEKTPTCADVVIAPAS